MLVSQQPHVLRLDPGAYGLYSYEVMDTCRPVPDSEAGDADLSLLSYLDCCENAYRDYDESTDSAAARSKACSCRASSSSAAKVDSTSSKACRTTLA